MSESLSKPNTPEAFNHKNLADIAGLYGLAGLRFVSTPATGIITENAILEDDGGRSYFVKLYISEEMDKLTSTYHAAELAANNPNIPVSLPFKTADNSFTTTINGMSLALFNYIEHDKIPPANEQAELRLASSMAKNLGLIHAVLVSPDDSLLKPIERWQPNQTERRRQVLTDIITLIQAKTELDDFDTLALEVATKKLGLLDRLKDTEDENDEKGLCHGDFHAHNTLWNENMDIVAICDWDNAGSSNTYVDFLNSFVMHVIGRRFDTFQTERQEIADAFIKSYVEATGQSIDIEKLERAYHTLMSDRIGTTWPMNQHYLQGITKQDKTLKYVSEKATALAKHYDEIWNFICATINAAKDKLK